ncbi:MAG: hypothetical protein DRI84_05030 [Bacteroidetes bacterium]|nr:MAG: hypothetical protein DRI84_05030 [Bacteroidota bacterium]
MSKNVIVRPVFNRPEMLKLSLDYEIAAREHYMLEGGFVTVFVVEHGTTPKVIELIEEYPYEKLFLVRKQRFGLSANILEGMKASFGEADDYVIYIEDDVLLHKAYFQYVDEVLKLEEKFSLVSAYTPSDTKDVNGIYRGHHYAALSPCISKHFFKTYVEPCACDKFYRSPAQFCVSLNNNYKDYWESKRYKYKDSQHHQQAGLINRLVDVAMIEEGLHVAMPHVNRHQHIGFYGFNRPGKGIPGANYEERLENLKDIITDADKLYAATNAKMYNDYRTFSPLLDGWDGTIKVR